MAAGGKNGERTSRHVFLHWGGVVYGDDKELRVHVSV